MGLVAICVYSVLPVVTMHRQQNLLGEINDSGQVLNDKDEHIGTIDDSNGEMRDKYGSFIGKIRAGGEIVDAIDGYRGKIDNFDYNEFRAIAGYLFFFDRALIEDGASSKITGMKISEKCADKIGEGEAQNEVVNLSFDLPLPPMPASQQEQNISVDLALPPVNIPAVFNLPPPVSLVAVDLVAPASLPAVDLTLPVATAPPPAASASPRIEKRLYKTYQVYF
jgi:hypothetical protein